MAGNILYVYTIQLLMRPTARAAAYVPRWTLSSIAFDVPSLEKLEKPPVCPWDPAGDTVLVVGCRLRRGEVL